MKYTLLINIRFIDLLEDVLEAAVVSLQDSVLGAHVQRPFLFQSVLHTTVSEPFDGL